MLVSGLMRYLSFTPLNEVANLMIHFPLGLVRRSMQVASLWQRCTNTSDFSKATDARNRCLTRDVGSREDALWSRSQISIVETITQRAVLREWFPSANLP